MLQCLLYNVTNCYLTMLQHVTNLQCYVKISIIYIGISRLNEQLMEEVNALERSMKMSSEEASQPDQKQSVGMISSTDPLGLVSVHMFPDNKATFTNYPNEVENIRNENVSNSHNIPSHSAFSGLKNMHYIVILLEHLLT